MAVDPNGTKRSRGCVMITAGFSATNEMVLTSFDLAISTKLPVTPTEFDNVP